MDKQEESNPKVYVKNQGKYVDIGRLWNNDIAWYGNYYVYCKKYSRGCRAIEKLPAEPDLLKLIAAIDLSEDAIIDKIVHDREQWINASAFDIFRSIRSCFVKVLEEHKQEMVKLLAGSKS
jgi:hypothetical protein